MDSAELPRVLLIEDNEIAQHVVRSYLAGICELSLTTSLKETLDLVLRQSFDLILLDINLPDADGFRIFTELRGSDRCKSTPILFLTGRTDLDDRLRGFELGADDYIVKPFEPREFKMRIAAKLKNLSLKREIQNEFVLEPFVVNVGAQRIAMRQDDGRLHDLELTANQFKILFYFLRHPAREVSRADLLTQIWGAGVHVSDRTIDTHVYAIRQQIGTRLIKSVRGSGYLFNPPKSVQKKSA